MRNTFGLLSIVVTACLVVFATTCGGSGGGAGHAPSATDDDGSPSDDDDNDNDDNDDDDDGAPADPGFARIPHGAFVMGSPADELGRFDDENQHEVTLTNDFELEVYAVTQNDFGALMSWNPSHFANCGSTCPVESLSWYDALAYANEFSIRAGRPACFAISAAVCRNGAQVAGDYMNCENPTAGGIDSATAALDGVNSIYDCAGFRPATEAEREYATRAGTTTAFYDGGITDAGCAPVDPNLELIGWYCGDTAAVTNPVGRKQPNAWGLYDVTGNVWDQCWDWYGPYAGSVVNPEGPAAGEYRVNRGGSYADAGAQYLRSAKRGWGTPAVRDPWLGFRLARTLP
jgi:formylglycine-generating enzyme required for sulfatase activity